MTADTPSPWTALTSTDTARVSRRLFDWLRARSVPDWLRARSVPDWLRARLSVDLRALAATRIALGVLLSVDLLLRSRSLVAFYTDTGLFPRAVLRATRPGLASVSVHALWGTATAQAALFLVAVVAAVALTVGYHSRLAAVVSWLLLVSLHARNPIVLNGGDSLLRRTLVWSCLLPVGARWSVDAAAGRARRWSWWRGDAAAAERDTTDGERSSPDREGDRTIPERVVGPATAALLLQPVIVYGTNALVKLRADAWPSGRAIRVVFRLDRFTLPTGDALVGLGSPLSAFGPLLSAFGPPPSAFDSLLSVFGWAWLALLLAAPLLVILRGWRRSLLAAGLAAGHLGMLATMWLGLFPLIAVAALLPYVHSGVWRTLDASRLVARLSATADSVTRLGDSSVSVSLSARGDALRRPWRVTVRRAGQVVVVLLLAGAVVWNAAALGYVDAEPGGVSPEANRWDMFAPTPPDESVWLVAPVVTTDGRPTDAYAGISGGDATAHVDWDRPSTAYRTVRWRKYLTSVVGVREPRTTRALAAGLCRLWDRRHDGRLDNVSLFVVRDPVRLDDGRGEDGRDGDLRGDDGRGGDGRASDRNRSNADERPSDGDRSDTAEQPSSTRERTRLVTRNCSTA